MSAKLTKILADQQESQSALYEINSQLETWQDDLSSHRPGKQDRVQKILNEIEQAKATLGKKAVAN